MFSFIIFINSIMNILTYKDLIKGEKNKNDKYERLQTTSYIDTRESYDDSNKIINGLNEEILSLKRKMKFVFEKDKEIEKLKYKITELENVGKNIDSKYLNENIALKQLNESLTIKNKEYLDQIEASLFNEREENDMIQKYKDEILEYKDIISELTKQNSLLQRELNNKRNENKKDDFNKNDYEKDLDTIDFDVIPKYEEKIKVDTEKFKNILRKKFKNKNYDKVLIKYGFNDNTSNKKISKNMMNDIIKEIMLN
jgi:hypothetical protein